MSSSYDELPYESHPYHYTHPDTLATIGVLAGMNPPAVETCRVLELGCGQGGNLIPMAQLLPAGRFVGVDLSERQVATGRAVIAAAGLPNVELRAMSISDISGDLGRFDYVICHGVYSWVPPAVQEKILEVFRTNMDADGLGYVSYNTYPGWHLRGMMREMMMYHVRHVSDPLQRAAEARGLMELLAEAADAQSLYRHLLRSELELLRKQRDDYLVHEHLEANNQPIYFHQFLERIAAKGLQYVSEPPFAGSRANLAPPVMEKLAGITDDALEMEQYMDFVRYRMFRWSVICHDGPKLDRIPRPESLEKLSILGLLRADDAEKGTFRDSSGAVLRVNDPLMTEALAALSRGLPGTLSFAELWEQVRGRMPETPELRRRLGQAVIQCYMAGRVELHTWMPLLAVAAGSRPRAMRLARLQAARNTPVTNLRHRMVDLDALERVVLEQLDGTRDRAALLAHLQQCVARGSLEIARKGRPVREEPALTDLLSEALDAALTRLAETAVLVE